MDYLDYFRAHPGVYDKVSASFDRAKTLHAHLVGSGLLDGVSTLLSIGSGDAAVEIELAKERGLKLGIVEPAPLLFERFQANLRSAGAQDRLVEAHQESFQEFRPTIQYDLVLSLFSWFAFGFDRPLLEKALSCTTAAGTLLICLQSEGSPSTRISAASGSSGINLTAEALSRWCAGEGFSHRYETYHGTVPADRFLDGEELTATGRDLVSFLLATPWEDLSAESRSLGVESLQHCKRGEVIDFEAGCLLFEAGRRPIAEPAGAIRGGPHT